MENSGVSESRLVNASDSLVVKYAAGGKNWGDVEDIVLYRTFPLVFPEQHPSCPNSTNV